ncbi:MAG: Formamidopyrimidine-DNA glycosylase [Firmicutes bacterium]|nr:Formamidopyrimidine-DNA glycosylase [Bacillota bacterium]
MPELPEVETIRHSLLPLLKGQRVVKSEVHLPKLLQNVTADEFSRLIANRVMQDIGRRGKYLLFKLSGEYTLIIHLRMTGQLRFAAADLPRLPHTHIVLKLASGSELRYTDTRQFGYWFIAEDHEIIRAARMEHLGVEPLSPEFTVAVLASLLTGKRGTIKSLLLNQHVVAGIGNIYADEALFLAGLRPDRVAGGLALDEVTRLYGAVTAVLEQGVKLRGTTFSDYLDGLGQQGGFQHQLKAYGRAGEACFNCGGAIMRLVLAGRGTHFCPQCQS